MNGLERWFERAVAEARKSLCLRSACGALLVSADGVVLGTGYNAPPGNDLSLRACEGLGPSILKPKTDRTCCVHAEWRALLGALASHPRDVEGSTMVFARANPLGALQRSGRPYCTVCSRLTLDAGVGTWALWHRDGIRQYSAAEYHRLSQAYDSLEAGSAPASPGGGAGALGA